MYFWLLLQIYPSDWFCGHLYFLKVAIYTYKKKNTWFHKLMQTLLAHFSSWKSAKHLADLFQTQSFGGVVHHSVLLRTFAEDGPTQPHLSRA